MKQLTLLDIVKEVEQCLLTLLHQQNGVLVLIRPTTSDSGNAAASNQHAEPVRSLEGPLWAAMSANTYDNAIAGSVDKSLKNAATYEPNIFDFQTQIRDLEFLIYSSC